jgi:hypothetical protein
LATFGKAFVTRSRSDLAAIPEPVSALLNEHIASFEQLLILLLLHRTNPKRWSTNAIADQLGIPDDLADALMGLKAAALIKEETAGQQSLFVFAPATADIANTVVALQQSYQNHPAAIMRLMSENAIARVRGAAHRAFSDAFLIRKGKDRG